VQRGIARYDKYGKGQTLGVNVVARADAGLGLAPASGERKNAVVGEAGGGKVEVGEYADVGGGGQDYRIAMSSERSRLFLEDAGANAGAFNDNSWRI
jgi:hypothetical protein